MLKRVAKSLLLGTLASAALIGFSLALAAAGVSYLMLAVLISGFPLSMLTPSSFTYWLVPEGGGPAAIGVMLCAAFVQFVLIFGLAAFWLGKRR